jgi:EmrB/QacA subfamily drug resistance transporter
VLGSGAVFLDSTVVGVALPRIGRELPVHLVSVLEGQSYVYNAYLLSLSALLIPAGALSDIHGRRRAFAIGLGGFGITSMLCGLAPNMELLILGRFLQGAAGALLVPGSLALIRATFEGEAQGRAYGTWAAASSGTTLLGPVVGGLLVDTLSWRVAFLINVPVLAAALWALLRHTPESRAPAGAGLDWLGAALAGLGVGGLTFGVIYGQQREWQDPVAFAAIAVGALASVALPFQMRASRHPLVPLELFRNRNFTVINISTLVVYGALYVTFYYQGLFTQSILGYTAAAAGLAGVPGSVLLTLLSTRFGALAVRRGPRLFMAGGPLLMALGLLLYARIPMSSTPWRLRPSDPLSFLPPPGFLIDLLPGTLLFGVGISMLVAPLTATLMASVPAANAGVASALNNAVSRVGPQLFGAATFVAITAVFYADLRQRTGVRVDAGLRQAVSPLNPPHGHPELAAAAAAASTDAFHMAMLICAGLLLLGAIINLVGIERLPPPRSE